MSDFRQIRSDFNCLITQAAVYDNDFSKTVKVWNSTCPQSVKACNISWLLLLAGEQAGRGGKAAVTCQCSEWQGREVDGSEKEMVDSNGNPVKPQSPCSLVSMWNTQWCGAYWWILNISFIFFVVLVYYSVNLYPHVFSSIKYIRL